MQAVLLNCQFESQMEYIAMWEALEADLAGLGGIDDVEDMLDDEGFLQFLVSKRFLSRQLL
jgi:hypothetical protein